MSNVKVIKNGDPMKGVDIGNEKLLLEAAQIVTTNAKLLAPVDTGVLRSSIGYATKNQKTQPLSVNPREGEAYVGTATSYAPYVEYGTRRQSAQPFLRPAVNSIKGNSGFAKKVLNSAMDKALRRGKKVKNV